jgi:hypothetical protein
MKIGGSCPDAFEHAGFVGIQRRAGQILENRRDLLDLRRVQQPVGDLLESIVLFERIEALQDRAADGQFERGERLIDRLESRKSLAGKDTGIDRR